MDVQRGRIKDLIAGWLVVLSFSSILMCVGDRKRHVHTQMTRKRDRYSDLERQTSGRVSTKLFYKSRISIGLYLNPDPPALARNSFTIKNEVCFRRDYFPTMNNLTNICLPDFIGLIPTIVKSNVNNRLIRKSTRSCRLQNTLWPNTMLPNMFITFEKYAVEE